MDDFQVLAGQSATARALAADSGGSVLAGGNASPSSGSETRAVVRRTVDGGASWSTIEDYLLVAGGQAYVQGITRHASGGLFWAGYASGSASAGNWHWIVRKSADQGATWTTCDDFQIGGLNAQAMAIGTDSSGATLFTTGLAWSAERSGTLYSWIVRRSVDAGATWQTVMTYRLNDMPSAKGTAVLGAPSGTYVAGYANSSRPNKAESFHWIIRRSTDGGGTWATVDDFQLVAGYNAYARALGTDGNGNIFAAGEAADGTRFRWIVRRSTNFGASWSKVDDFALAAGKSAGAYALGTSASGAIYAGGYGTDAAANWIVRKTFDGGGSWSTDDLLTGAGARALLGDASGAVYAAGGSGGHWIVRKSGAPAQPLWRGGASFLRGDGTQDGRLDLADAIRTASWLFASGPEPGCLDAADSNDDGRLDLIDALHTLNFLFLEGDAPPSPGPSSCGPDPTPDDLAACSGGAPGC